MAIDEMRGQQKPLCWLNTPRLSHRERRSPISDVFTWMCGNLRTVAQPTSGSTSRRLHGVDQLCPNSKQRSSDHKTFFQCSLQLSRFERMSWRCHERSMGGVVKKEMVVGFGPASQSVHVTDSTCPETGQGPLHKPTCLLSLSHHHVLTSTPENHRFAFSHPDHQPGFHGIGSLLCACPCKQHCSTRLALLCPSEYHWHLDRLLH
ncbi:hypothetical protein B0O80DRAFT_140006 [Mortierella sp. GBAus27b]|nr:hypothetical protein B0O80DRAFT_140006 [Mortierella sp. GBAus27b]